MCNTGEYCMLDLGYVLRKYNWSVVYIDGANTMTKDLSWCQVIECNKCRVMTFECICYIKWTSAKMYQSINVLFTWYNTPTRMFKSNVAVYCLFKGSNQYNKHEAHNFLTISLQVVDLIMWSCDKTKTTNRQEMMSDK